MTKNLTISILAVGAALALNATSAQASYSDTWKDYGSNHSGEYQYGKNISFYQSQNQTQIATGGNASSSSSSSAAAAAGNAAASSSGSSSSGSQQSSSQHSGGSSSSSSAAAAAGNNASASSSSNAGGSSSSSAASATAGGEKKAVVVAKTPVITALPQAGAETSVAGGMLAGLGSLVTVAGAYSRKQRALLADLLK